MNEEQALLAAIRAAKQDDTVRLAYADWCDEQTDRSCTSCSGRGFNLVTAAGFEYEDGCLACKRSGKIQVPYGARAEFIRLQIATANGAGSTALQVRQRELFATYGRSLLTSPLDEFELRCPRVRRRLTGRIARHVATLTRGFVTQLWLPSNSFLSAAPCITCKGIMTEACSRCSGRGTETETAKLLLAAHPIQSVTLVDLVPWQDPDDPNAEAWWNDGPGDDDAGGDVPDPLFNIMWARNPANQHEDDVSRWLHWDERGIAASELSKACIIYGERR